MPIPSSVTEITSASSLSQPGPHYNAPAGLGAVNGIADDVSQRLAHSHRVEVHVREVTGLLQRQFNLPGLGLRLPSFRLCG